ncbi:MAG: hypothetical protein K9K76_03835 [Halanaerobiales bacterium]|nr:hypothetical protein [Halanaerobiales bacterium]
MRDRFVWTIIKNNWKTLLILILILVIGGFIIKNVGEIPYENQHLMTSTHPIQFKINNNEMRGFIYLSYWVQADPKITEGMTSNELGNYLMENGHIELANYEDEIIDVLQNYDPKEIKENWMNNYDFFKQRDIYFIDGDKKLLEAMKNQDIDINLKYQLKKMFFVYLDQEKYNEFIESLD